MCVSAGRTNGTKEAFWGDDAYLYPCVPCMTFASAQLYVCVLVLPTAGLTPKGFAQPNRFSQPVGPTKNFSGTQHVIQLLQRQAKIHKVRRIPTHHHYHLFCFSLLCRW